MRERERERVEHTPPEHVTSDGGRSWGRWLAALLAVALVAVVAWLIWEAVDDEESPPPNVGATIGDISDDSAEFVGDRVTVSGAILETIDPPHGLLIGGEDELLVVGTDLSALGAGGELAEGDVVQVTGTVRLFRVADIEDDLGVDLTETAFEDHEEQAVVVADELHVTPTREAAQPQDEAVDVTLADLVDDSAEFAGEDVRVEGGVTEIIGPRAFLLGREVLVVGRQSPPDEMTEGDVVAVEGRVLEIDAVDFAREFGLALDRNLLRGYDRVVAIHADAVEMTE